MAEDAIISGSPPNAVSEDEIAQLYKSLIREGVYNVI
jgi:hypothetical protein